MKFARNGRRIGLALTALAMCTTTVAWADDREPASRYQEYVALGDSWAADATSDSSRMSTQFRPSGCAQSASNYAKLVAAALAVPTFRDVSCGGAVTGDMVGPQTGPQALAGFIPPQFDALTPTTDLVTVLIGGNDADLARTVFACLTLDATATPCLNSQAPNGDDHMSTAIAAAEPKVAAVVRDIRDRAPHARILLLNYFKIQGTDGGCFPAVPISPADSIWLGNKLIELNAMLARVASATGVELVDTYATSDGHDACQAPGVRWGEGLVPFGSSPVGLATPFHPNQLGANHQADSILATLGY
ncbi:SGNH/GDSL hydrolase family protein [Nocardia sp. SYP-A9097]|uniref:SGNH/GDSL hydrolase family protein n=1 Tax=Nocardia sp. SYP-A9097 TaxID=2663237 RepID=UPI001891A79C|nr:SGNH/GDSL hydrolase family protein [Nocardia sp. SYP-A9097]